MNFELWFRGKPIEIPEDRLTEREQQTIDFLSEVAQSRMRSLPECVCQKRYGHRDHAEDCPAKDK